MFERSRDGQSGARRQKQGVGQYIEIKRSARGEHGAHLQGHAAARYHHGAAGVVDTGAQHPAIVIVGGRWRGKAVVDAAIDIQVATGAQGQAAGLGLGR